MEEYLTFPNTSICNLFIWCPSLHLTGNHGSGPGHKYKLYLWILTLRNGDTELIIYKYCVELCEIIKINIRGFAY